MREVIEEVVTRRTSAIRSRAIRFSATAVVGVLYTAALNLPVAQIDITPDDSGPEPLISKPLALDFIGTDALRGGWEGVGLIPELANVALAIGVIALLLGRIGLAKAMGLLGVVLALTAPHFF